MLHAGFHVPVAAHEKSENRRRWRKNIDRKQVVCNLCRCIEVATWSPLNCLEVNELLCERETIDN